MSTDNQQETETEYRDRLYTQQRELHTKSLTEAMANENSHRVAYNRALSELRRAEKETKRAAEALGELAQKRLGL